MKQGTPPNLSVFIKLLAVLMLVVFPLYILSLIVIELGTQDIREEQLRSMNSRIDYFIKQLDIEFDRMIRYQQEIASDQEIDFLSHASGFLNVTEKRLAIDRLQGDLIKLKRSSSIIGSVNAHIRSLDHTVSSEFFFEPLVRSEYDLLSGNLRQSPFLFLDGRLLINAFQPGYLYHGQPTFILSIEISLPQMAQFLDQLKIGDNDAVALIQREEHWLFAEPPREETEQLLLGELDRAASRGDSPDMHTVEWDHTRYLMTVRSFAKSNMALLSLHEEARVLGSLSTYKRWIWFVSVFSLLLILAVSYYVYKLIHYPLKKLVVAFRKLEHGILTTELSGKMKDEFAYLYERFNMTMTRLNSLIQEVYEQKYRVQQSELKQLQAQINPHFLYNSFFILAKMAKESEVDHLYSFSRSLGSYYKFMTRSSAKFNTLAEEIEHAKLYVRIQSFRFGERIRAEIEPIPDPVRELAVPKLIVQPLVENAYKYALEPRKESALLQVRFVREAGFLTIVVEDNGEAIGEETLASIQQRLDSDDITSETTGMINIHRRLKIWFGPDSGIQLRRRAQEGMRVDVVIPLQEVNKSQEI